MNDFLIGAAALVSIAGGVAAIAKVYKFGPFLEENPEPVVVPPVAPSTTTTTTEKTTTTTTIPAQAPAGPVAASTAEPTSTAGSLEPIDLFVAAIQTYEGWYPGSTSFECNNPGNIRCIAVMNPLAVSCTPGGFCVFKTYADGYNAQKQGLLNVAKGLAPAPYSPDMTIQQFFDERDPASDNNDALAYATFVAARLSVNKDQYLMKNLLG